jgi:hypothetical protein
LHNPEKNREAAEAADNPQMASGMLKKLKLIFVDYAGLHCILLFIVFIMITFLFKLINTGFIIFFMFLLIIMILVIFAVGLLQRQEASFSILEKITTFFKEFRDFIAVVNQKCNEDYAENQIGLVRWPIQAGQKLFCVASGITPLNTALTVFNDDSKDTPTDEQKKKFIQFFKDILENIDKDNENDSNLTKTLNFLENNGLKEEFGVVFKVIGGLLDIEWLELMFLLICMNLIISIVINFQSAFLIIDGLRQEPYLYLLVIYYITYGIIFGFISVYGKIVFKNKQLKVDELVNIYLFSLSLCIILAVFMIFMSDVMYKRDENTKQFQVKAPSYMLASLLVSCCLLVYILSKITSLGDRIPVPLMSAAIVTLITLCVYVITIVPISRFVDMFVKQFWIAIRSIKIVWPDIPFEVNVLAIVVVGMLLYFSLGLIPTKK